MTSKMYATDSKVRWFTSEGDINSKLVRRRGKVYIVNKKNPKYKARQG